MSKTACRTALVTGAGGFIGSHLTELLLAQGWQVRALVRYNSRASVGWLEPLRGHESLEIVLGDVIDPSQMEAIVADREVVFHLAALIGIPYSYVAPRSYVAVNVGGTINLLEAARKANVKRFVHTSTSETYGTAQYAPIDELHPLQGQSPYSASKIGADKLAESYFKSFELPVVTVRPFNTYGPRQSARAVIPSIVTQALAGDEIHLGSLDPVRDLTFVTDTAAGFLAAAESDAAIGETVNLGTGEAVTIGELAETILAQFGNRHRIVTDPARIRPEKSEVMKLLSNNAKARELMGWTPKVSLSDGLAATIEWIRGHQSDYQAGEYAV